MSTRGRRSLTVAAVTVAFLGLTASQASASTTVSVRTTDSGAIGGTGIFWGDNPGAYDPDMRTRERLGACDKQSDGLRVYAEVQWGSNNFFAIEDADGAGNGCHEVWLPNIKEETKVYIKACLKDGHNGRQRYCSDWGVARA
nr:hypothetical protein GCM10010200_017550 [Actinomadura rugatobispora]